MSETTPPVGAERPVTEPEELWSDADVEKFRKMIGGKSGIVDGAGPALLFVASNAIWGLHVAAITATAYGVAALAYRAIRRQPLKHSLIGLVGLALSAGLALKFNSASAFFAPGAAWGAFTGVLLLLSVVFRQPTSSLLAMAIEQRDRNHYERPEIKRMHMVVTAAWALMLLTKSGIRFVFIKNGQTELLGASVIFLGYPLTALMVTFSVFYLRRGTKRLAEPLGAEPAPEGPTPA